ncbi:hypothetical protein ACFSKY_13265 [Azotobacter chroococcum]|uniref:hypothetical protein n=1 Tax=Azotobacter chroococcum TaxID=353 RepID=UPI00103E01FC|nr:hypothetical protein [Azotobacter chroococcum]TBV98912.1 hypothetical protein E0E53_05015 [Azotobacter chroococcum]
MIGRVFLISLALTGTAHAGPEQEMKQQQQIENQLKLKLEGQMRMTRKAYQDVMGFISGAPINRDEQTKRLIDAEIEWDIFIEKICLLEGVESINTQAERANKLLCMIKRNKEKEEFYKSVF